MMKISATESAMDSRGPLRTQATREIGMLTAEFLLGMAVNLIGMSSEISDIARIVYNISLILHILIGVGLLLGAVTTIRQARKMAPALGGLAWTGLALLAGTFVTGILAMQLENDWWSFMMALGFIVSYLVYGVLLFRSMSYASKKAQEENPVSTH
jgi:hypothetical protein